MLTRRCDRRAIGGLGDTGAEMTDPAPSLVRPIRRVSRRISRESRALRALLKFSGGEGDSNPRQTKRPETVFETAADLRFPGNRQRGHGARARMCAARYQSWGSAPMASCQDCSQAFSTSDGRLIAISKVSSMSEDRSIQAPPSPGQDDHPLVQGRTSARAGGFAPVGRHRKAVSAHSAPTQGGVSWTHGRSPAPLRRPGVTCRPRARRRDAARVAERAGASTATVSRLENGIALPSDSLIDAILDAYCVLTGVSRLELLERAAADGRG